MTIDKYLKISLPLTVAGVLFSGYLSAVKLFSSTCAFGESCPLFLGYPACYYGFAIFLAMFIGTVVAFLRRRSGGSWSLTYNLAWSVLGVIFAGSFVAKDLANWIEIGYRSTFLGLSTCAYGFVFFAVIFGLTVYAMRKLEPPELTVHVVEEGQPDVHD